MSRFFLILLIALLPLRGWSAQRMAVYMAASETAAVTMAMADRAMPADCPMLLTEVASAKGVDQSGGKSHHGCQSCHLCMSLAALEVEVDKLLPHKPLHTASPRADRFDSADLARAAKPPIS